MKKLSANRSGRMDWRADFFGTASERPSGFPLCVNCSALQLFDDEVVGGGVGCRRTSGGGVRYHAPEDLVDGGGVGCRRRSVGGVESQALEDVVDGGGVGCRGQSCVGVLEYHAVEEVVDSGGVR